MVELFLMKAWKGWKTPHLLKPRQKYLLELFSGFVSTITKMKGVPQKPQAQQAGPEMKSG